MVLPLARALPAPELEDCFGDEAPGGDKMEAASTVLADGLSVGSARGAVCGLRRICPALRA